MKIINKIDMLNAMGDIKEEYIRKADRLLARHRTGEAAVKMEITPMKFSWRSIAAVAACLVVLVGVTFGIKAFMNKPVDVLTPAQQAYLDEWKEKLGGSVNVAYAVDRLNFIELDIPDDVTPLKFIDENRAVFIRDEKRGDEYVKTIEIYNFADKSYSVIAGGSGKINLIKQLDICYADNDYVIHHGESYQVTGVFIPSAQLSLYNVKTGEDTVIYTSEYGGINWQIPMIVSDGKVYFTVYDQFDERSIHVYDIQQRKEIDVIANAGSPQKYKGDILYITEENGRTVTRSISGKYSYDGGVWATEYGLYQYNYTGEERLKDLESGKVIIPGDTKGIVNLDDSCDFALQFGGFTINSTAAAKNALGFLFYAPTNEALVFQNGDGFSGFSCFGWGATVSKKEPDGTVRTFLVTDKKSKNAIKIPKLEPDPYLEEMKYIFGARGSVDYARNKLDITEYDISGFESMPLLVDKNRAVITGKDNSGYPEIRLHDLGSGKQTALYSCKDDPEIDQNTDIDVLYADKDYAVFDIKFYAGATLKKRELRVAEINGNRSYTAFTMEGGIVHRIMVIVDDTLYFYTYKNENGYSGIFRYKIGTDEKAVFTANGSNLMTYDGRVYYYETVYRNATPMDDSFYIYTRALDGKMPVDTEKYPGWLKIGKYGIFYSDSYQTVTDCVNGKELLSGGTYEYLDAYLYDSLMMIIDESNKDNKNNKAIYNTKTNELLVFAKDEDFYCNLRDYREFDGGMYYALENDGVYSKLCVITEKDAKSDENNEKPYLDQMKELFGAHGSIDYARNKLNIKEYDLSGLNSDLVFIDKDRYIVSELAGDGLPVLKMYDLKNNTDTVIYDRKIDPNIDDETKITLLYADTKYAVFTIYFYAGATMGDHWLRVLDHTTGTCYTVCAPYSYSPISNKMAINNDSLYFTKTIIDFTVICRYDIGSGNEPEEIAVGGNSAFYDQDLYFVKSDLIVDELGQSRESIKIFRSGFEETYYDCEPGAHIALGRYGIFASTSGGNVYDLINDKNILSGGKTDMPRLEIFDSWLWVGDDNKAMYDLKTGELLIFEEGDDFYKNAYFREFDGGMYAYTLDDNSLIDKVYVITERDSSYSDYGIPEVYIPTNSDEKYPLNIWLDIDTDTIKFKKYDDPLDSIEEYLDGDKLKFTMNFALKENFYDYDSAELMIGELGTFILSRGKTVQVPMTMGNHGQLAVRLLTDTTESNIFSMGYTINELKGTLSVEFSYHKGYEGGRLLG